MRFFKYLVLIFASIISIESFAATIFSRYSDFRETYTSYTTICSVLRPDLDKSKFYDPGKYENPQPCFYNENGNIQVFGSVFTRTSCPAKDTMSVFFFNKNSTSVPQRRCIQGCTFEYAGGPVTDYPDSKMVVLWATGNSNNCTNTDSDSPNNNTPPCDIKDPYGGCYVPPDDKCIRLKDGSITCPDANPPPKNNTCNGATYCKRPPEGCGEGYVSGSFNGEQLCVRSAQNKPSNPPKPDDPQNQNNCMNGGSYCPQPPDNTQCPSGYYETTYNGSKICVKNNPNPEKPNSNDPNNSDGGGDNGGDGGGDNGGGTIDVKGIIDAINALKAALLNALSGISGKIDKLINGQAETNKKLDTSNEHLKNIKDESVKTNAKLDKSNGHLEKIEEATKATSDAIGNTNEKLDISNGHLEKIEKATQAASEGIGETNKKLDKIFSDDGKEQIEQLGEQSSDPRYAQAEAEATTQVQKFANVLSYKSSHACISDLTVTNIPLYGSLTVPLSKWCDLLALVKILMKLAALMLALRMFDATVRAF